MKIDLKDAFFSVAMDEELQRKFAFQWEGKRYAWTRIPQGWRWSSIFFHETGETILKDTEGVNYADDIILGGETYEELLQNAIPVFDKLDEYGLKVNYRKVTWCSKKIKFLGFHLENGKIKIREYLEAKWKALT